MAKVVICNLTLERTTGRYSDKNDAKNGSPVPNKSMWRLKLVVVFTMPLQDVLGMLKWKDWINGLTGRSTVRMRVKGRGFFCERVGQRCFKMQGITSRIYFVPPPLILQRNWLIAIALHSLASNAITLDLLSQSSWDYH